MKHQQVNVDYWSMIKSMFTYGALTALCWIMLRLFHTAFTLPRRMRSQQENIQNTLQELQGESLHLWSPFWVCQWQERSHVIGIVLVIVRMNPHVKTPIIEEKHEDITKYLRRFPDLNITEEDLKNAEKELEEFVKETEEKKEDEEKKEAEEKKEDEEKKDAEEKKEDEESENTINNNETSQGLESITETEQTPEDDKKNN